MINTVKIIFPHVNLCISLIFTFLYYNLKNNNFIFVITILPGMYAAVNRFQPAPTPTGHTRPRHLTWCVLLGYKQRVKNAEQWNTIHNYMQVKLVFFNVTINTILTMSNAIVTLIVLKLLMKMFFAS